VIIEFFLLGLTAEALQANIDWKLQFFKDGVNLTQNFRQKGHHPETILRVIKLDESTFHMVYECRQKIISFCHNARI